MTAEQRAWVADYVRAEAIHWDARGRYSLLRVVADNQRTARTRPGTRPGTEGDAELVHA